MTTTTISISELIDKRYALLQSIEELQRQDAELSSEIMHRLLEAGAKQAFGEQGIGYAITSTTRYEFGKAAYRYLEDKGLTHHFVAPPKITKSKIEALIKEGELTYSDMAAIEKNIVIDQSPYSLRKIAEKTKAVV